MDLQKTQEILLENSIFDIEITTRCNKDCWMCPRESFTRKKEDMKEKVFDYLKDWLPTNASIFFAGFGEPTLHPLLASFINKLKQRNISNCLISNGKKLNYTFISKLFQEGLNKLKISFIIPEETELLFNSLNTLALFKENIVLLFLLTQITSAIAKIKTALEEQGYTVEYKQIHNRGGYLYLDEKNYFFTCGTFFKVTYINVKGEIHICSNDINNLNCIGNIFTMSFLDVLNYKRKFFGLQPIANLCRFCNDEYRTIHLENPYL